MKQDLPVRLHPSGAPLPPSRSSEPSDLPAEPQREGCLTRRAKRGGGHGISRICACFLSLVLILPVLASCGETWDRLWSREPSGRPSLDDPLMDWNDRDTMHDGQETHAPEAYPFNEDQIHKGTNILYTGPASSVKSRFCVVIDPGHQLKASKKQEPVGPGSSITKDEVSAGATGVTTGQLEYELNLAVALNLRNELCRRGYSVAMIRETNEVSVSNKERAEIANGYVDRFDHVILVRIHANGGDPSWSGALMVCQSKNNPYPNCAAHYKESYLLSESILNAYCSETGMGKFNNPIRGMDDKTGTNWSIVPTTILEMGYLSHSHEDSLMKYEDFRKKAAVGVANGIDVYFETVDMEAFVPVPIEIGTMPADTLPPDTLRVEETAPVTIPPIDTPPAITTDPASDSDPTTNEQTPSESTETGNPPLHGDPSDSPTETEADRAEPEDTPPSPSGT